ncbi:MAG: hypothetical protein ACM3XS_03595 [Bacteroidota bacterium]
MAGRLFSDRLHHSINRKDEREMGLAKGRTEITEAVVEEIAERIMA